MKPHLSARYTGYQAVIDSAERISVEDFRRVYSEMSRPLILRGGIKRWKAIRRWNLAVQGDRFASRLRGIKGIVTKRYGGNGGWIVPVDTYVECLLAGDPVAGSVYLGQIPLPHQVAGDIQLPEYVGPNLRPPGPHLWIGPPKARTELHRDGTHNLLCQVYGRKRLWLFSPLFDEQLYARPFGKGKQRGNFSPISFFEPNLVKFPKFQRAECVEVTLRAGDALFLPLDWWHAVEGLELNISVNFWWRVPIDQYVRSGLEGRFTTADDLFRSVDGHLDDTAFSDDLQLARAFLKKGLPLFAALLAGSYVNVRLQNRMRKEPRALPPQREGQLARRGKFGKSEAATFSRWLKLAHQASRLLRSRSLEKRRLVASLDVTSILEDP